MFKSVALPNKEFETKEDLFKSLKENKDKIIALKKGVVKYSQPFSISNQTATKNSRFDSGYIYPVINTTNVQDSHLDCHLKGIWNKTVNEQQGKVHYLINHKHEIGSVIAYPKDVEMIIENMNFKDLGSDYNGTTEALIFKTNVFDYSNNDAANVVKNKIPMQNSISMIYVKIEMGINSTDKDFAEEKKVWDKYHNEVVNKDFLYDNGHCFFISEAKIHREGSMVLAGSNDQTPILYPESKEQYENLEYVLGKENFVLLSKALEEIKPQKKNNLYKTLS